MEADGDYLFEASWEVCNKVGGIYTVVKSKISQTKKYYNDKYFVIGPFFSTKAQSGEFKEKEVPDLFREIFKELGSHNIFCHFGTWLTEGEPNTILIDYAGLSINNNDIKKNLWDNFKIDSLNTQYHDFDEPVIWSTAVGMMLEKIEKKLPDKKIIAQFHEWLSGAALLYLKEKRSKIGKVFTTHATMLGRTLATDHEDIYNELKEIDPVRKAYEHNIQSKFLMEKECAKNADAFTTVSEITGIEAQYFLGKKPDVLLPNGLDIEKFPTFDDASIKHKRLKEKVYRFIQYYFFPYYTFNLEKTLIYFIAGRPEFHDKGIDYYIKALGKLNRQMKQENADKTIAAFVWVPGNVSRIRPNIIENKTNYEDIHDSINDAKEDIHKKLIYGILSEKELDNNLLLEKDLIKDIERKMLRFKKQGSPSLSTHELYNEENETVLNAIKAEELLNREEDKVKIIYYPIFLTGADQLLDLSYYESLMASHLGIFPSYYEPWGYTPLETAALGIASVTTDLAGFGRYIKKIRKSNHKNEGIFVLDRLNNTDENNITALTSFMYEFMKGSKQDRIENKLRAKRLASYADWKNLIENYIKAHNLALKNTSN